MLGIFMKIPPWWWLSLQPAPSWHNCHCYHTAESPHHHTSIPTLLSSLEPYNYSQLEQLLKSAQLLKLIWKEASMVCIWFLYFKRPAQTFSCYVVYIIGTVFSVGITLKLHHDDLGWSQDCFLFGGRGTNFWGLE